MAWSLAEGEGSQKRKKGQRKTAAHKGVKVKNLQRGTAAAADWEETRHVHQLCALCLIFDQLENIYCAMQLCINARRAPRSSAGTAKRCQNERSVGGGDAAKDPRPGGQSGPAHVPAPMR